ncbi:MAG: PilT/PilU family type 4a pilus ATPase [Planctomycetes bacterium]|nr:PilT/PilU family type 4a pilus ATPase [Planctomycetota bacterium]
MLDILPLLNLVVEKNASDLHLAVGRPPTVRRYGRLIDVKGAPLTPEDTAQLVSQIIPERCRRELEEVGTTDFAYALADKGRFRVSAFHQKGSIGVTLRLIPSKLLSFEEICLPPTVKELLRRPRGLLLVTGPTGSGKTTTLATMLDYVNSTFDHHIITIEDPIEYYHNHRKSIVTQREVHVDVPSFAEGLRRSLRQDPDVIMVGEMRDLETISAAITAAETGHLVLATLHTTGSARTVDRIIDAFPQEQQEQIRVQLSVSLVGVISQVIMPRADRPGLQAAFELMVMTSAIENHIRKNETFKIISSIQTSKNLGMQMLDDHLYELYTQGRINEEYLLLRAQSPRDLRTKLGLG